MFGMEDPVAGGSDLTIVVVEHPSLAAMLKIAFVTSGSGASRSRRRTTGSSRGAKTA